MPSSTSMRHRGQEVDLSHGSLYFDPKFPVNRIYGVLFKVSSGFRRLDRYFSKFVNFNLRKTSLNMGNIRLSTVRSTFVFQSFDFNKFFPRIVTF